MTTTHEGVTAAEARGVDATIPAPAVIAGVPVDQPVLPMPEPPRALVCPTCGYHPNSNHEVAQHREELDTVWLFSDPAQADRLVERWHCSRCQPHQVAIIMCAVCGASIMLGGELATPAPETAQPEAVQRWLADHGWRLSSNGWHCDQHPARQQPRASTAANGRE